MKRRRGNLGKADPQGRLDVLLYRVLVEGMERVERDHGVVGLSANMAPIFERWILRNVPGQNLIPQEVAALLRVCEQNRRTA